MARPSKYPHELREQAIRMVAEVRPNYGSEHEAIHAVAGKLGSAPRSRCANGSASPRSMLGSGRASRRFFASVPSLH
jgi:hypothetical protein